MLIMKNISVLVSIQCVLLFNVCLAYVPLYQVANQDLLKGIILGALLSSQKHPNHFLNVLPMPFYNAYVGPQTPYGYGHQDMQGYNRESTGEQTGDHPSQQTPDPQHQKHHESNAHQQPHHNTPTPAPYSQPLQHQQSETLYDPVMAEPGATTTTTTTKEPVIPSMDTIHKNLGLPSHHSLILMILPAGADVETTATSPNPPNGTGGEVMATPETHYSNDPNDDKTIRTNAVKVGAKHLNPKGWKPVPKLSLMTTTAPTPQPPQTQHTYSTSINHRPDTSYDTRRPDTSYDDSPEESAYGEYNQQSHTRPTDPPTHPYDNRFQENSYTIEDTRPYNHRYHNHNRYIEKSQFGLRNRDNRFEDIETED